MVLTIKEIAKLCAVSTATVSRAINDDPSVDSKTKEYILDICRQHNYNPSASARAMRKGRTKVVGIICTRLDSYAENRALRGILQTLKQHKIDNFIAESLFDPELLQEHLRSFKDKRLDGVIVFGFSGLDAQMFTEWEGRIILVGQNFSNLPSVYYDNEGAINAIMSHLYQQGHREIGYIGVHETDYTTGHLRYQAYLKFCKQHSLVTHAALGDLSYESAYHNTASILLPSITAILCASDTLAIGVNKYLVTKKLQSKDHIDKHNDLKNTQKSYLNNKQESIVVSAIGNNKFLKFLYPETLTLDFGYYRSGEYAAQNICKLLQNPQLKIDSICVTHQGLDLIA